MNIDMSAVPKDFPRGKAGSGGWFCRFCGDPIAKDDEIFKPVDMWVCKTCFDAGNHTTAQAKTQPNRPRGGPTGPNPQQTQSQKQAAQAQWDAFQKGQASSKTRFDDDTYKKHTPPPPPPPSQPADLEEVNDSNWIEIIFEVIPDRHVKRVYAALSRVYHPDTGGDTDTQIRINGAYQKRKSEST